jgi:hypothetical protein
MSDFWKYAESIDLIRGRGDVANTLNRRADLSLAEKIAILEATPRRESSLTLQERGEQAAKKLLGKH